MKKDRRNVCPICGSDKLSRWGSFEGINKRRAIIQPRQYTCGKGHHFYTGEVIKKYEYDKRNK